MTFFMVTATFPPDKAKGVGKIFSSGKLAKLPPFVKRISIFVVPEGNIKTYAIYKCEDEKAHEGYKAIAERYTGYYELEGWKHKIEHLLTPNEALPMIGLS